MCCLPTITHGDLRTSWCEAHFPVVFRVNLARRNAAYDKATLQFATWAENVQRRVDRDASALARAGDNRAANTLTPERLLALSADGGRRDYAADTTQCGATDPAG